MIVDAAIRYDSNPRDKFKIVIQDLWKRIIFDEVFPCVTRELDIYHLLRELAGDVDLQDEVQLISHSESSNGLPVFEDVSWSRGIECRLASLVAELKNSVASEVFPLPNILWTLEGT
jgi:nuclear pore complex protein Nup155